MHIFHFSSFQALFIAVKHDVCLENDLIAMIVGSIILHSSASMKEDFLRAWEEITDL